jgi:predicted NAD-dependent protein-ADP-ribosyltransferase YbiA (DUF1768 family)
MYAAQKSKISKKDPALDFDKIRNCVSEQQASTRNFAAAYFNRQIRLLDKEAYEAPQSNPIDFNKESFLVRRQIILQAFRGGEAIEKLSDHHLIPKQLQPRDILNTNLFSLDGSVVLDEKAYLESMPEFFRRSRRVTHFRSRIHLRGGRYTISANPTFELRQKLATYAEDFQEGLQAWSENPDYVYRVAIADYVKNAVLTMFNSFLYEEKIGHYFLESANYQALRRDGQRLAQAAVEFFYGTLGRIETMSKQSSQYLNENLSIFSKLQAHILEEYKKGVFSSRHMTRPEASHPLVIAGAALRTTQVCKVPDIIAGLPAGSTELSLLQATAFRLINRRIVSVLLVPVSLHSIKHDFDETQRTDVASLKRFLRKAKPKVNGHSVLIVDDNSSTGSTLQLISDVLKEEGAHLTRYPSVAEADLVRSELDLENSSRVSIATPDCFHSSVSVLPVSRIISPKNDMRQLIERKKMAACVKHRYIQSHCSLARQIVGKVYVDIIENSSESTINKIEPSQRIMSFRKTFLSNFHEVAISYVGEKYISVEHAYQAMKFSDDALSRVTNDHIDSINKRLAPRGAFVAKEDLPNLFVDQTFSAGSSKVAANQLRILGYVRKDWDDVKSEIMCQLLVQKFSNADLYDQLKNTGSRYLVEGNDWGDTYWGYCEDRGRNALGRMLMEIRKLSLNQLRSGVDIGTPKKS